MKVITIFGTRPETIKMAPVIQALHDDNAFQVKVCVTGQHRQMLDQMLKLFAITPDYDLNIMLANQDLFDVTANSLLGLRQVLQQEQPDLVLVQGDTATAFAGALAAFYLNIPVGHVEAGLRTRNLRSPFPEEANRQLVARLAKFHFAHTNSAKDNLLQEGINAEDIYVTGNTVIDALLWMAKRVSWREGWQTLFATATPALQQNLPIILVTAHRRENFGAGFADICNALTTLAQRHPNVHIIYPVHLNPNIKLMAHEQLSQYSNIHLIAPLDYEPFVYLMKQAKLILTDSGGVQEEAPSLGKPVLVMRNTTERSEAITAGVAKLVGTDAKQIISEAELLLTNSDYYQRMATAKNPYGDGHAAKYILDILRNRYLSKDVNNALTATRT